MAQSPLAHMAQSWRSEAISQTGSAQFSPFNLQVAVPAFLFFLPTQVVLVQVAQSIPSLASSQTLALHLELSAAAPAINLHLA